MKLIAFALKAIFLQPFSRQKHFYWFQRLFANVWRWSCSTQW